MTNNNFETTNLEDILSAQIPTAPASLRGDVDSVVRKNLKRQTFRDDLKWLGFCLSILLLVVAAQWIAFSNFNKSRKEISTLIASSETAEKLPIAFGPQSIPIPTPNVYNQ